MEFKVVRFQTQTRLRLRREVVREVGGRLARVEGRVRNVARGGREVVRAVGAGRQAVLKPFDRPGDRRRNRLPVVGRIHPGRGLRAEGLRGGLLRDDVHDPAHGVRAVEDRGRPLDHFDALDLIGRNEDRRPRHRLVFRDALAVDHDERAEGVFAADLHALHALTAVVHDLDAGDVFEEVAHGLRGRALDVFGGEDRHRHRHVHQFLLDAGRGDADGFGGEGFFGVRGRGEGVERGQSRGHGGGRPEEFQMLHGGRDWWFVNR